MRQRVQIVTDSTVQFTQPDFAQNHNVVVVPLIIHLGNETFRDGADITTDELFARVKGGAPLPTAVSPSVESLTRLYQDLSRSSDAVVSIHVSSKLSRMFQNAAAAGQSVLGRCNIQPIDSLSASVGLGLLVQAAVKAAEAGESADEIVRIVRGMIPRLYIVFFVEALDYLQNSGRIGKAQAVLGSMLGIKPFMILEEGDIQPMEKVRTRVQAIEKLWEFVCEFSHLEYLGILQQHNSATEDAAMLLERLAVDFPRQPVDLVAYGPSLATFVGPNSMGVAVFEGEHEGD